MLVIFRPLVISYQLSLISLQYRFFTSLLSLVTNARPDVKGT